MNEEDDIDRIAKVQCHHCDEMVYVYRTSDGRVIGAAGGALVLGSIGAFVGGSIVIATAGWGSSATYYLGGGLVALDGGYGYIDGDTAEKPRCPNCKGNINLGL